MEAVRHILVCEDEPDVRGLIGDVLEAPGDVLEFAATGEAALERLAQGGVDVLVLDLGLPGVSGQTVLAGAARIEPRPRIVVVTGRTDYESFARAMRGGAAAYLVKPFRIEALVQACRPVMIAGAVAERRASTRQPMQGSVRVVGEGPGANVLEGTLLDLSVDGAQVQLEAPLEPFQEVRLQVDASTGLLFAVRSRVEWCGLAQSGFAHGLGFLPS
jgi:DNA-binding response OmpR family regulator